MNISEYLLFLQIWRNVTVLITNVKQQHNKKKKKINIHK